MLKGRLRADSRPPDGKLHPSGDLIGSLRHSQLRAAGAPTIESELVSDVRLMTGTMWHTFFEEAFRRRRLPIMTEVRLDQWMPEGWSGTADWIIWDGDAFVLGDLKTIKGEGIPFVKKDGIKQEHLWQLSSYWYALERMGIPLVRGFAIYYLPQNVPPQQAAEVEPLQLWGQPLPRELVESTMEFRWAETQAYLAADGFKASNASVYHRETGRLDWWLNERLAPVQERVQKTYLNVKQDCVDVKLVPHWSAAFCPFPNELCDCREQGSTKIGQYVTDGSLVIYQSRKGYEAIEPTVEPTRKDLLRLANSK